MNNQRRAIGIIRVSVTGGREGESFASPREQAERIAAQCERDGLTLVKTFEEMDVSGGKPLDQRPGLRLAVAAIEAGEAEVVAAAYFDRLFRSLTTQAEVVERVEAAGGQVIAVDVGRVTGETAGQWLSGTMMGAVSEYYRRSGRERSAEGQRRAIARGAPPWANVTPGYRRRDDGCFEPDPTTAPAVVEAFRLRADGATIANVRTYLASAGLVLSYTAVTNLLRSRVVVGELHFGSYEPNLQAWEAIVDREMFDRVQRYVAPRGRQAQSERLLARLGVLRCAGCGSAMTASVQKQQGKPYYYYRCGNKTDCTNRSAISATIVEAEVVKAVLIKRADVKGRASIESVRRGAEVEAELAQQALDSAIRTLTAVADEPAAIVRLAELRADRDAARDRLEQLGTANSATITLIADRDWADLSIDEQRALIRATVHVVAVSRGRGLRKMVLGLYGDDAEAERILGGAARRMLSE